MLNPAGGVQALPAAFGSALHAIHAGGCMPLDLMNPTTAEALNPDPISAFVHWSETPDVNATVTGGACFALWDTERLLELHTQPETTWH